MSKTSTIHFTINDLASKSNGELVDINKCFDHQKEYKDVCQLLDLLNYDVSQEIVDSILEYSSMRKY
jgi:hypothetical protein